MATITTASGMSRLRIWMMPVPEGDISHHQLDNINNLKLWSDDSIPEDPRLMVPLGFDEDHQSIDQQQRKLSSSMSSSSGYSGSSGSTSTEMTKENSIMEMKIGTWKKLPEKTCGFCYIQYKRLRQTLGLPYPRATDPGFWVGHYTKDDDGNVVCPQLRKLMCPLCFATGKKAHTLKFCPLQK